MHERLREIRELKGINQAEMARLGGVGLRSQQQYEKGTTSPSAAYIIRLWENGFDIGYLLTGDRDQRLLGKTETELLNLWFKAPEPFRQIALVALQMGLPYKVVNNINNSLHGSQIVVNND